MDMASLVLRLCLGFMFTAHGLQKAFGAFGGPGIEGFSKMLAGLGLTPPIFWAYVAAYTELVGGILVILGLGTRTASSLLLIVMLVAVFKVHLAKGFFLMNGGFEYAFIIAGICLSLILMGPGKYSLLGKF